MNNNEQWWFLSRNDFLKGNPNIRDFPERDIAEKRTRIWHYTNSEALFKIVSGKTLKFSRIDCVNDLTEKESLQINDLYLRTFVSCFSHDEKESIPLWHMYTEKNNGVRVEFEFEDGMIQNNMFTESQHINPITEKIQWNKKPRAENEIGVYKMIRDVSYSDDIDRSREACLIEGEKVNIYPDFVALRKSILWNYETETRIILFTSRALEHVEAIFLPLDFAKIKKMKIVFNPWMSPEVKKSIELTVNYYMRGFEDILDFFDSELNGVVIRKQS